VEGTIMRMRSSLQVAVAVAAAVVAGCSEQPVSTPIFPGEAVAARAPASFRPAADPTIVGLAVDVNAKTGEFSTLIAAVVAADLVDALSAVGQRTVFAPTDAAFAALGLNAMNVGALDKEFLTNVLLYHVTPGRRASGSVVTANRIRMANGDFTTIRVENGTAYIDESAIIDVDFEASNGIIHVIDRVLLP
jgi:uncharacterized surface protein with fasciclin (FAS1) repeats